MNPFNYLTFFSYIHLIHTLYVNSNLDIDKPDGTLPLPYPNLTVAINNQTWPNSVDFFLVPSSKKYEFPNIFPAQSNLAIIGDRFYYSEFLLNKNFSDGGTYLIFSNFLILRGKGTLSFKNLGVCFMQTESNDALIFISLGFSLRLAVKKNIF